MIGEALNSELLKLSKNRWSLFWAFGFPPLFTLVSGIVLQMFIMTPIRGLPLPNVSAPLNSVIDALFGLADTMRIFPIAGAAILFAGEYRWETWRAILPRNERTTIMLAKFSTFAIASAVSIALCGLAGLVVAMFDITAMHATPIWPRSDAGGVAMSLLIGFGGAFLQLMATGALVMLIAVASRAMIASIIGAFIALAGVELLSLYLRVRMPDADLVNAALPNVAGNAVHQQALALLGDPDAFGVHLAAPGALALTAWAVVLSAAAIAIFRTQDLSKE